MQDRGTMRLNNFHGAQHFPTPHFGGSAEDSMEAADSTVVEASMEAASIGNWPQKNQASFIVRIIENPELYVGESLGINKPVS